MLLAARLDVRLRAVPSAVVRTWVGGPKDDPTLRLVRSPGGFALNSLVLGVC